jgi:protease-4
MKKHPLLIAVLVTALVVVFFVAMTLAALSWLGRETLWQAGDKVGVVEVKGLIADSRTTLKQLDRFSRDQRIKAIVLRVNSPGGAVSPSQDIMREIEKIKKAKKVVASMGAIAASGGYYVSCAADLIMASPGTTTGSIGVVMRLLNMGDLTRRLGLDFYFLKAGAMKDLGNPFRPMTREEQAVVQNLLDSIHRQFINDVARNRKLPADKVKALADGRVFTGEEAKKLGLVDELGNLPDAIQRAGRLAGIRGRVEAVYPERESFSFLRWFLGQEAEESLSRLALPYPEPAYLPAWVR